MLQVIQPVDTNTDLHYTPYQDNAICLQETEDFQRLRQKPRQSDKWADWVARSDALAADILVRRGGKPVDIDALLAADRADLEARDDPILSLNSNWS